MEGSDGWPLPPLRYAVQGFAALRRRESKWAGAWGHAAQPATEQVTGWRIVSALI
jgi:hypothetical protein